VETVPVDRFLTLANLWSVSGRSFTKKHAQIAVTFQGETDLKDLARSLIA
jgi:hypothetical protein